MERMLSHNYREMGEADRADIVSDVITSLLVAVRDGRVDPDKNPGAYLRKAAERRAIDHFRRSAKVDLDHDDPDPLPDDDVVARHLDIEATAQEVEETFARLAARGEHRASQVIARWLVLAEKTGDAPSLREAATEAGVSHDTVARYLDLFRGALLEVREKRQG
jgi:RNA polymerase sigma factor (sigma-70 family)